MYRIGKQRLHAMAMEYPTTEHPHAGYGKPETFGECDALGIGTAESPCPYVSCKYHLALDVRPSGGIVHNHPNVEVWEMRETCSLRVADRGPLSLEEVGDVMAIVRERVRQIESVSRAKMSEALPARAIAVILDALDDMDARCGGGAETLPAHLPAPVIARRYLPVVRVDALAERPALDAEARALAASRAPSLSPRTWQRSAARRAP